MKKRRLLKKEEVLNNIEQRRKKFVFIEDKRQKKMDEGDRLRIYGRSDIIINTPTYMLQQERKKNYESQNLGQSFLKPYQKKMYVDYDAIIVISSYNRYDSLFKLIDQLYSQDSTYKINILVYNDGSSDPNYCNLQNIFPDIRYISSDINNGKRNYWKTITTLFTEASKYITHAIIQIDDDFFLCNDFINNLMDEFFRCKMVDNKNVAIYYHKTTSLVKSWGINNWVDGGVLFDSDFLKTINYSIDEISETRWESDSNISSGVWQQISEKIEFSGLFTSKLDYSLVMHNGNDDSKMNSGQRTNKPLNTINFKND